MSSHRPRGRRPNLQEKMQKTELCKVFVSHGCQKANCRFAHGSDELREKPELRYTKLCSYIERGEPCRNGDQCLYAHSQDQLIPLELGHLNHQDPTAKTTKLFDLWQACEPPLWILGETCLDASTKEATEFVVGVVLRQAVSSSAEEWAKATRKAGFFYRD